MTQRLRAVAWNGKKKKTSIRHLRAKKSNRTLRYALRVAIVGNNPVKPALRSKIWQRTPRYGVIFGNATTPALRVTLPPYRKVQYSQSCYNSDEYS